MAKIIRVDKRHPRRKKLEHFKLKFRVYLFRVSYLTNLAALIYLANEQNLLIWLTNSIKKIAPILESLITSLPL